MIFTLPTILSATCLLLHSDQVSSAPLPQPHHEVHVDLIDSIFQIPIQTLNAVGNLLKNVHEAKRNLLSVNVHISHPNSEHQGPDKPGYTPTFKPSPPAKPRPSSSGYPSFTPQSTSQPLLPDTSSYRPVSGTTELSFPDVSQPSGEDNFEFSFGTSTPTPPLPDFSPQVNNYGQSSLGTTGSATSTDYPELEPASSTSSLIYGGNSPSSNVQPLSLDLGPSSINRNPQNAIKEKNFKEYVQRKLAEKNLNDNRINHF